MRTNVRPSVRMCVRTYIRDPVRLRLRHLYQVELCSFIVRYPTAGHPCTVDTILVYFFIYGLQNYLNMAHYAVEHKVFLLYFQCM